MAETLEVKKTESIVVRFAGDSGDGMQLTGSQFTDTSAFLGNDLATFPDFPAEIRAPIGTMAGVSGFQVHIGSKEIFTPGDRFDVLVAMNAAGLKSCVKDLKQGGIIIANTDGFDKKNLRLAKYKDEISPLEDNSLVNYTVFEVDVTKLTRECLKDSGMSTKEIDRSKNMFVLGMLYWLFDRSMDHTINFLNEKFGKKPMIAESNIRTLKAGYHYGENAELFTNRFQVEAAPMEKGTYRNITGNQSTAIGLIAASEQAGLDLFLGSYPITPASDILHELSKYKEFGVKTFQAEDEISAICAAIGASFGGKIGLTTTSGPGIALKGEAIGLATILELPLVICNIQRGGPSTGLPTKTEQSDLLQALYGRHGEGPIPVIAAATPADCFDTIFEAVRIALEHMTPIIFLSDGYIANGSEPWKFPTKDQLGKIKVTFADKPNGNDNETFLPYKRDEKLSRPWAIPGTKGLEHRIGGLEKAHETGNVSYDPENHEFMTILREQKIQKIADYIPEQKLVSGKEKGKLLVLGWGSTYGAIKTVVASLEEEGHDIAFTHLRYMNPFPKNLGNILKNYDKVLIPEMNRGQLQKVIASTYNIAAIGFHKTKGQPFGTEELREKMLEVLK